MPPESPVFGCLPHLCSPLIVIFQSPLSTVRTTEEAVGRNDGHTNGGELHSYCAAACRVWDFSSFLEACAFWLSLLLQGGRLGSCDSLILLWWHCILCPGLGNSNKFWGDVRELDIR